MTNELAESFPGGSTEVGDDLANLIIGSFGDDDLSGLGGGDLMFGLLGDDLMSGGLGNDSLFGGFGEDRIAGNKGDDQMFGGFGDDLLVWNNGDGSDLMDGGFGYDRVQVNFDTDLVNEDLQNKDTAEYSVTNEGVQFARVELNDQAVNGLFQLDIRNTETLETNFGGGDDTARIVDTVLDEILLDLDGGEGVDQLDFSKASEGVEVDLAVGTAGTAVVENFENVIGTAFDDVITGDDEDNALTGGGGKDRLNGGDGNDVAFGGDDNDKIFGEDGDDELNGGNGVDRLVGGFGNDRIVGNKGNDRMFGDAGDDLLVWNNGDGSDFMSGGKGDDRVQVNFNTDLVNDNLQNKDVAEFSVTGDGVQFARVELNDQAVNGLFQLDIRSTETLETNFGDGDDTARIVDDVLDAIQLDLDGGDGVDTLDFSEASAGIEVDLDAGTVGTAIVENFENVVGTEFNDVIVGDDGANVIEGGSGNNVLTGGAGTDVFSFVDGESGTDTITDFEIGIDQVQLDPAFGLEAGDLPALLTQAGDDVELALGDKTIVIEDALVEEFNADDFLIA